MNKPRIIDPLKVHQTNPLLVSVTKQSPFSFFFFFFFFDESAFFARLAVRDHAPARCLKNTQ